MLITAVTGLVIFRRCSERLLPLVTVLLTVGWIALSARHFLATNFQSIAGSVGNPDATRRPTCSTSHTPATAR